MCGDWAKLGDRWLWGGICSALIIRGPSSLSMWLTGVGGLKFTSLHSERCPAPAPSPSPSPSPSHTPTPMPTPARVSRYLHVRVHAAQHPMEDRQQQALRPDVEPAAKMAAGWSSAQPPQRLREVGIAAPRTGREKKAEGGTVESGEVSARRDGSRCWEARRCASAELARRVL